VAACDDLRALMRSFPSGVAVLSVDDDGDALAITVGSLVSLSLEPPLVGLAVGVQSAMHEPMRAADRFALSLLAAGQQRIAQHFARSGLPPIVRWREIDFHASGGGRLIDGAVGWLECTKREEVPVGDHTFVVGAVESAARGAAQWPLVYLEREYVAL
jgi:flavin reductase (DIM6/NTAB) family NADH-FMN oxidoreductase RutF